MGQYVRQSIPSGKVKEFVPPRETDSGRGRVPEAGTEAAVRVAEVLLCLAVSQEPMGLIEISRRLGISKAVVHRILHSLASRRLVAFEEQSRACRLGPAAVTLGGRAMLDMNLRQRALPKLRELQEASGETATVSELIGVSRVYLDQVPSLKEIKMTVELGRPFPLYAGASSRASLAFAPADLRREVLEGPLEALTPKTIIDREKLADVLEDVRADGVAVSFGERQPGAASVAAPLLGSDGYAVGAISVCGPVDRFGKATVRRLRPLVQDAAYEIAYGLGWERA